MKMNKKRNHELIDEQRIENDFIKTNYSSREDEISNIGRELTTPSKIKAPEETSRL